jgi:hypothetical protein
VQVHSDTAGCRAGGRLASAVFNRPPYHSAHRQAYSNEGDECWFFWVQFSTAWGGEEAIFNRWGGPRSPAHLGSKRTAGTAVEPKRAVMKLLID